MKIDMLFFLGFFFTVFGVLVTSGWFLTGSVMNLYGLTILIIGLFLVAVRPKPPLRFFIGRVSTKERMDFRNCCRTVEPTTGVPRFKTPTEHK